MKVTINVLASDFVNNFFVNMQNGLEGCPMERAITRVGLKWDDVTAIDAFEKAHSKICSMFYNEESVKDFSFQIEIPE